MTLDKKRKLMDSLGKDVVFYFDMDGVLAKWDQNCPYEKTWQPGYFYGLPLEQCVYEAIRALKDAGFKVCILSAAYMNGIAEVDKAKWLTKHGMEDVDRIFCPCGQNKADYIKIKHGVTNILLDDYNVNLLEWEKAKKDNAKFIAVKFLNGINGGSNKFAGRTISHHSSGKIIANTLADFAVMS